VRAAFAQEAAADAAAHAEAFWQTPEFWVAVAFVLFVAVLARPVYRIVGRKLDEKIDDIRDKIDRSAQLREEAQEILTAITRKQADESRETEAIVARAREEAALMRRRLTENLEASLARREQLAKDRIAQAETDAVAEVRATTTDVALAAARTVLTGAVTGAKADELVDAAIKEIPGKLN
jgi:F-type H+-transporting ATPase subunit b